MSPSVPIELEEYRDEETGTVDYQCSFPWGLLIIEVGPTGDRLDLSVATPTEVRRLERGRSELVVAGTLPPR